MTKLKTKKKKIGKLLSLFMALLVVNTAIIFAFYSKDNLQIILLLFTSIALVSYSIKKPIVSAIPFTLLSILILTLNFTIAGVKVLDIVAPDRALVKGNDGHLHRTMDMSPFFLGILFFFIAIFSMIYYHRKMLRNKKTEFILLALFLVVLLIASTINHYKLL